MLVGYAEPHIRSETEALLLGMEILPYKVVEYRGARLKEFDLDAALARRPALICVDELAHTNAPGMRHAEALAGRGRSCWMRGSTSTRR